MARTTNTSSLPPSSKAMPLDGKTLAQKLHALIGTSFPLSGKPRTDGAKLRKLIASTLQDASIENAEPNTYKVIPPKKRGIPKLLKYFADSFLVTTGDTYNLQIWNRIPNSKNILIRYDKDTVIRCKDIMCIMVKIDIEQQKIESIIVATPQYIEHKFGKFGVPTIKYQALINATTRNSIVNSELKYIISTDTDKMKPLLGAPNDHNAPNDHKEHKDPKYPSIADAPIAQQLLSIEDIANKVIKKLIGKKLCGQDTKNRGQALEREVATLLGYSPNDTLVGSYPDIYNQALEVKIQDSPTIDLGKETPVHPTCVYDGLTITTEDIRYLIALTNPQTSAIEGVILAPGKELADILTMVSGTSYKCQRSIPMQFFKDYKEQSVFNP